MATAFDDDIEDIQMKLQTLPSDLKESFLRTLARVYEEESWSLIDFLQQSRDEMNGLARDMSEEQDNLRSASSMLTVRRQTSMQSCSSLNSVGGANSPRYPRSPLSARSLSNSYNEGDRKPTTLGQKSSEDEESLHEFNKDLEVDEYHEEAEEVLKNMKGVETAMQKERLKQSAKLRLKKEAKIAKKKESENKATELIDRANQITEVQSKDKERQEQKMKEKLANKREKQQQQQQKKSKNTAETSLSDENWAVSYQDGDQNNVAAPVEAKPGWSGPRESAQLAEVEN